MIGVYLNKTINAEANTTRHSSMLFARLNRARHKLLSDIIASFSHLSFKDDQPYFHLLFRLHCHIVLAVSVVRFGRNT